MKFKLTDGRPWYKQVITGLFKAVGVSIVVPAAAVVGTLIWFLLVQYGLGVMCWALVKAIFLGVVIFGVGIAIIELLLWGEKE